MKTKVFPLSNVVLYAKGWYKTTDDVWDDLKKILVLDDYTPYSNSDVYSILLKKFDNFDIQASQLREVLFGLTPQECWKVGYYTKDHTWGDGSNNTKEYDMPTAFIYYVLSTLRFIDNKQWIPTTPKYSKHPKNPILETKRIIKQFNKKTNKSLVE